MDYQSDFSQDPILLNNEGKIFRADVSNLHDLTKRLRLLFNQIFPIQSGEILIINSISKLLKVEVGNVGLLRIYSCIGKVIKE